MSDSKPWHVWLMGLNDEDEQGDRDINARMMERAGVPLNSYHATEAEAIQAAHDIAKVLKDAGAYVDRWRVCYAMPRRWEGHDEGNVHAVRVIKVGEVESITPIEK